MNISNSLMSCCHFVGTWAIPYGTPGVVGAFGTEITCKFQGALLSFGFSVPYYYTSLSVISYIAIRNDFDEKKYEKIEPIIHIVVLGIPSAISIVGLKDNFFHPAGPWCWVDSFPSGCEGNPEVECIYPVAAYYRQLLLLTMVFFSILTIMMM